VTESEWLASGDPAAMLHLMASGIGSAGKRIGSDRKLRLFACAVARRSWDLFTTAISKRAIEIAERFADGEASEDALRDADHDAYAAFRRATRHEGGREIRPQWPASCGCEPSGDMAAREALSPLDTAEEKAAQAALLREIIGNPWRPVSPYVLRDIRDGLGRLIHTTHDSAPWLTPQVVTLAQAAYQDRQQDGTLDPVTLLATADALEEAGCTNADILTHLRSPGPHFRGCHVLDCLLGKE